MKKYLVGGLMALVFVVYSVFMRNQLAKSSGLSAAARINLATPNASVLFAPTKYKNGTYTGSEHDLLYGNVQVAVVVQKSKISAVNLLQTPDQNATTVQINSQAMPLLCQETIQNQSANLDIVAGATMSSQAFIDSLSDALKQARP